jgi:hypothetical protein
MRIYTRNGISTLEKMGLDMLPVIFDYIFTGKDGREYLAEIDVFETTNIAIFPSGISGTFRLFRISGDGEKELIYLIDNHAPYDFHEHDKLPNNHDSRKTIHATNWQEAWTQFQLICREKTK